jgi:hypothetical protein
MGYPQLRRISLNVSANALATGQAIIAPSMRDGPISTSTIFLTVAGSRR